MGRRGPAPTPSALKRLRGETRPSRLNHHEPVPAADVPKLPADMDADAKVVWRRVMRDMRHTGVIRAADADVLRCYCEAVSR
jgi:phage terminase small subunit